MEFFWGQNLKWMFLTLLFFLVRRRRKILLFSGFFSHFCMFQVLKKFHLLRKLLGVRGNFQKIPRIYVEKKTLEPSQAISSSARNYREYLVAWLALLNLRLQWSLSRCRNIEEREVRYTVVRLMNVCNNQTAGKRVLKDTFIARNHMEFRLLGDFERIARTISVIIYWSHDSDGLPKTVESYCW